MVLLSLDASSSVTGWSIIQANNKDEANLIAHGEIQLKKYKKKSFPLEYIKVLYDCLTSIIKEYKPEIVYLEDIYAINQLTYKSLSRIRGICENACLNNSIKQVYAIAASSARKVVLGEGKGGTKSAQICTIMEDKFKKPLKTIGFDQIDAILIGLYGVKDFYGSTKTNSKRRPRTTKPSDSSGKKRK